MRQLLCAWIALFLASPALATIVVFGHHQGLNGQSTSPPGDQVPVYEVRLVNDGNSSLQAIALTLSDLSSPTGITASAISQLSIYKSDDAVFDAQADSLAGTQTVVNIGAPTTVPLTAPLTWSGSFPYFLVVATLNSTHTDEPAGSKDAFRVGSAGGAIQTSSGNIGSAITADDANRHTIDVVATQTAFATLPADASAANGDVVSGQAFATQPVVEARDDNGNVDVDASGSVTLAVASGSPTLSGTTAQSWGNGRATFTNLAITSSTDGATFTLQASASGLSTATTAALTSDVVASQLVFSQQAAHTGVPNGDVLSGVAFQTQPIVQGQNAQGTVDLHFQDQVTLTTATGTLSGTATVQAQSGQATFTDLVYTASADQESFQLQADDQATGSGGDLAQRSGAALTADIVATQIVFATAPTDPAATNGDVVSGQTFATQPVVEARNAAGQRDLNFTGTVALSLPAGNPTLSGTVNETWVSGRADFAGNGLRVTTTTDATTFALQAASGSLSGQSATLTADAIATQMAFATLPADASAANGDVVSGVAFATQPVVEARDDNDVVDIHYQGNAVNIAVASGSATLSGTTTQAWSSGRATFTNLAITSADGATFTLQANNSGLPQITTSTLQSDVVASQLVFSQQAAHTGVPNGDVLSGVAFQTQPIVQGQNAQGTIDLHFQDQVTLTTATGTLSGTATVQAQSGQATFTDLVYTASADQESFQLQADDQATGSGGDLAQRSGAALTADIVATQIVFATAPTDASATNGDVVSGQAFATQPVVEARNAAGQRDVDASGSATLAVASGNATLSGTTAQAWSSGRATFTDVAITSTDTVVFTLQASASGLSTATTAALTSDVVASQLVFSQQAAHTGVPNGDVLSGVAFQTQPVVQGQNAQGTVDLHFQDQVTLTTSTGTLSGTATVQAQSGQATFTDLVYTASADQESFQLQADDQATGSGGDLAQRSGAALTADIVATQIVFATAPTDASATNGDVVSGQAFATQPVVEARNAAGQRDVDASGSATLAVASGNATLSGTTAQAWSSGRATFTDVAITSTDTVVFTLQASASGLSTATTAALTSDVVASQLVFSQQAAHTGVPNGDVLSGVAFQTQPIVQGQNAQGTVDLHFQDQVTLTTSTGTLSGTATVQAQSGQATFTDLVYTASADQESFQLQADDQATGSGGDLAQRSSAALTADIVATQIVFATAPTDASATNGDVVSGVAFATQPVIEARNAAGQRDFNFTGTATLSLASGSLALGGTTGVAFANGRADFAQSGLKATATTDGETFALKAATNGLPDITGATLTADVVATQIAFATLPADPAALHGDVVNGQIFAVQPTLEARDVNGQRDLHRSGTAVSLSVASGSAALAGTTSQNWISGLAAFSGLSATGGQDGDTFALKASSAGLQDAQTNLVCDVVASQLVFTTQPAHSGSSTLLHGTAFETQPVLAAHDQSGVRDQHATGQVALSVQSGSASLSGQTTRSWSSGLADFSSHDLSLSAQNDGESVVLKAEVTGLPAAFSDTLNVDIRATRLVFADAPRVLGLYNSDLAAGALRVEAQHPGGQVDAEFNGPITLQAVQLDSHIPASGQLSATPGLIQTPASGAVSYSSVVYTQPGRFQLLATSPGLEAARSPMIELTGSLALEAPVQQVADQLAVQRDATPARLPLFAFQATPAGEKLALAEVALRLGFGGGMRAVDIDSLHLWRDRGTPGQLDPSDQPLAAAVVAQDSLARFGAMSDSLQSTGAYLVTWDARSALAAGWTLQARLAPADLQVRSAQASNVQAPATGDLLVGAQHRVGDSGPPYRVRLSAQNPDLVADDLSRTALEATIVDAQDRPISQDHASTVTFSMLSGPAFIEGAVAVRVEGGRASTQLRAGSTTGTARVRASAPGLRGDTLAVALRAGPTTALELSATPPSIHLDETDRVEITALLKDARGNAVDRSGDQVLFSLAGPGVFAAGLAAVTADSGVARTVVTAAEPGTLRVAASLGGAVGALAIPVISTQPPYLTLSADRATVPADGSIALQVTAALRDPRGQLLSDDHSTPVRFSLVSGHALLGADEVIAADGQAGVQLRALGIAGPIVVRAAADGLQTAEIELQATAVAPHRVDLVALPSTIAADRNSTAVLSAVVRDSLGNIVPAPDLDISFSVEGDRAEIIGSRSASAREGNARTTLRSSVRAGAVDVVAEAPGLVAGRTTVRLVAGPAAKIQLRATPAALPADAAGTSRLTAEILDVHGNRVVDDSTSAISFSVSGGPGEILDPSFAVAAGGRADAVLRSTGAPGKILVFAGASGLAPATFEIPVRQAMPPQFTGAVGPLNLVEDGEAVRLDLKALVSDEDSSIDDLSFAVSADSAQVRLEIADGTLIATPTTPDYWGELTAALTVRDPTGLEASVPLPIAVQPRNDPPRITSLPDTLIAAAELFVYRLAATDVDGDALSYSLVEGPPDMAFDKALRRAVWRNPSPGRHAAAFAVSDGEATTYQRFEIQVGDGAGLRFATPPVTRARRGQIYSYQPVVENAAGDALVFSLAAGPQRMRVDPQTGMLTWIPGAADDALVAVALQVTGGGRQQTQRFQIRLVEGNTAPVILSTPAEVAWVDSLYLYALSATDADGDTLVYTVAQGPPGMRINPLAGLVAWVPEAGDLGFHEIAINAYDGQATTAQRFRLHVRRPSQTPQLEPLKGIALDPAEGLVKLLELDPLVADPDHDDGELTWSFTRLSGDPVTIDYDPDARTVSFAAPAFFNTARVRLTVSDPDGFSATRDLRLGLRERGDFNGDAAIDLDDFFRFVDAFGSATDAPQWDASADLNGDGQVDFDDFFDFVERFEKSNAPGN